MYNPLGWILVLGSDIYVESKALCRSISAKIAKVIAIFHGVLEFSRCGLGKVIF